MSSLSKSKKRYDGLNLKQCDDRFTRLPSCLITKILSCLPTKDAVATSILSTKWKGSWMSITNLDFDDKLDENRYEAGKDAQTIRNFSDFVTKVLLLRERTCLGRVRLKCYRHHDDSLINAWLSAIIQCNVQELELRISFHEEHQGLILSSDIFHCNTLVNLTLGASTSVSMPSSACLPALKTLDLAGIEITDVPSFTRLLSGCPVLEELRLCDRIGAHDMRVANISSRVLKKLIILVNLGGHDLNNEYQIVIDTPALEYLDLGACYTSVHVLSKMDHLIKADISLGYVYEHDSYEFYYEVVKDLVEGISHVQTLILSHSAVLTIRSCDLVLPEFSKLTYLKFEMYNDQWCFLAKLLEKSPCLETLYIQQDRDDVGDGDDDEDGDDDDEDEEKSSILSHLKEVEIDCFENFDDEVKWVEYILKNAKVLEKLILHYSPNPAEIGRDVVKALLSLPRTSTVCEVVVIDWRQHG